MFSGRRITITREGCYYLFVSLFICGGAVGGEVNLMMLLSGFMIAPVLLHWRILSVSLQGLDLERRLPAYVHAGDPVRVHLVLRNRRRRVGSWCLLVQDRVRRLSSQKDPHGSASTQLMFPFTQAGKSSVVSYQWQLNRRGAYRFGPLRLMTRFPFGLLAGSRKAGDTQTLLVCPRTGEMTRKWFQVMEADRVGGQETYHARGSAEGDYYGLRHWHPGDSRRWIHWRTSARIGRLAVKQFEQQRDRDIAVVLDLHTLPDAGLAEQALVEVAVSMAATILQDLGHRTGVQLIFAASGASMDYWSASSSNLVVPEVNRFLATVQGGPSVSLGNCLDRVREDFRPGSQLVVISTRARPESCPVQGAARPLWINCDSEELSQYFQWPGQEGAIGILDATDEDVDARDGMEERAGEVSRPQEVISS